MPTSQTIWNAILTVVGVALAAIIGYLYTEVVNLKEITASTSATRFTEEEASQLRSDMTVTLTTIDKRLAIMENNNDWIRQWVTSGKTHEQESDTILIPEHVHDGDNDNAPIYDLREQKQQAK